MNRSQQKPQTSVHIKKKALGARAFAAISAVEGLKLSKSSKQRLKVLQNDHTLTPEQRRQAVIKAYAHLARKK